jgi:hypothetical protein
MVPLTEPWRYLNWNGLSDVVSVVERDLLNCCELVQSTVWQSLVATHLKKSIHAGESAQKVDTKSAEPVSNIRSRDWPPMLETVSERGQRHNRCTHTTSTRYTLDAAKMARLA